MKYIITDAGNNVLFVQDFEASEEQKNEGLKSESITQEIADEIDAIDVPMFWVDGNLLNSEQFSNPAPYSVSNYQIKRALNTNPADREAVEALIAGADQDTVDGWNHAQHFKSDHAIFIAAVDVLGWSQEKVDDYLRLANTFE